MLYFFLLVLLVALSSIVHHKARGGAGIMIIKVKVEAGRGGAGIMIIKVKGRGGSGSGSGSYPELFSTRLSIMSLVIFLLGIMTMTYYYYL
jgi:hypothetical protein